MPLTTSHPTSPRKRTSSAVFATLVWLGAWGCSSGPEPVYVDLSAVAMQQSPPLGGGPSLRAEGFAYSQYVPDLPGQDFLIGSAEQRAQQALDLYRKEQEQAAQAVLDRLKDAYLEEARLYEQTEEASLKQDYAQWVDSALEDLHRLFLDHAAKVGPLRYDLTKLVGFPDPDPQSLRVPLADNVGATKTFQAAKALRQQIAALDEAYRVEVEARMAETDRRKQERLGQIAATASGMRSDAAKRAQQESESVAQKALAVLEHTALDPAARLAPVPGASSSVNSGPVSVPSVGQGAPPGEARADVQAQLQVFLKTYGYRLTFDPGKGRNVTREFVEWRRKYKVGR